MSLPGIPRHELQNIMGHTGRLCQIVVVTLLLRNHVSVCNGNTREIPKHVSALNRNVMATIILIKITHVINCVT